MPENNDKGLGFVCLTFVGTSLIAVFDNGQVFGIADVPVDKICQLASTDPKLLSVAIQKLKFLKCTLPSAQLHSVDSLRKAVVFTDNATVGADGFGVAIVDRVKGLWVGLLGSKTGLRCQEMENNFSNTQQTYGICSDLALLPSPRPHDHSGGNVGITSGGEWGAAVVLFGTTTTLCVVNLALATVLTTIPLSFAFARISLLTCIPPASMHAGQSPQEAIVHMWDSFVVGLVPYASDSDDFSEEGQSAWTSTSAASVSPRIYAVLRGVIDSKAAAIYLGHALPPSEYILPMADSAPPSDLLMLTAQNKGLDRGTENVVAMRGVTLSTSLLHTLQTIVVRATRAGTTISEGGSDDGDDIENPEDFNSISEGDMHCTSEAGMAIGRLLRCVLFADDTSSTANNDSKDDESFVAMAIARAQTDAGHEPRLAMTDILPLLQRQVVSSNIHPSVILQPLFLIPLPSLIHLLPDTSYQQTSCGDVMAVVSVALATHSPCHGSTQALLSAADHRLHDVGRAYADPSKEHYLHIAAVLQRQLETACELWDVVAMDENDNDDNGVSDESKGERPEGHLRRAREATVQSFLRRLSGGMFVAQGDEMAGSDGNRSNARCNVSASSGSGLICCMAIVAQAQATWWCDLVRTGKLAAASVLMSRHLAFTTSHPTASSSMGGLSLDRVASSLCAIPDTTPIGHIITTTCFHPRYLIHYCTKILNPHQFCISIGDMIPWITSDILPLLRTRNEPSSLAVVLVNDLVRRARVVAHRDGHPFAALAATEMAAKVSASFSTPYAQPSPSHNGGDGKKCEDSIQQLRTHLQLQVAVWRSWGGDYEMGERPNLAEVESMGLEGLVWERLSDRGLCDDVDVAKDVSEKVEPLVQQFGGDLNTLLLGWVEDTVNKCVIVDPSPDASLLDSQDRLQQDTCTLLRLVTITLLSYIHPFFALILTIPRPSY